MKNLLLFMIVLLFTACEHSDPYSPKTDPALRKKPRVTTPPPPAIVQMPATDWNISVDTVPCGYVVVHWDDQPNAVRYYITDMTPDASPGCPPPASYDNILYYTLGAGCCWFPTHTYDITINYQWKDTTVNTLYVYKSLPYSMTAGTFFPTTCP